MRDGDRLRTLQMRVRRHQRVEMRLRLAHDRAFEVADHRIDAVAGVHDPEARAGRHLVVPAAPRVQSARGLARFCVEQAIHKGVDVLVRADGLLAVRDADGHPVESALDDRGVGGTQHTRLSERGGPGLREFDVEGPEADVRRDRSVDRLELRSRPTGESSTPELV